jgi:hypothetical protein
MSTFEDAERLSVPAGDALDPRYHVILPAVVGLALFGLFFMHYYNRIS